MKKMIFLASLAMGLLFGGASAFAEEEEAGNEAVIGVRYYDVQGDEGRFREDNFRKDRFHGGIESLLFDAEKFDFDMKAVGPDNYKIKARIIQQDFGYVSLKGQWARRFYDGSNEAWDPSLYGLDGDEVINDFEKGAGTIDDGFNSAGDFADRPDAGIFADRMDVELEAGLTMPDLPRTIVGWHRWSRKGKELLLRSERSRVTDAAGNGDQQGGSFFPRARSIPALNTVEGASDLYYFDISKILFDDHMLRARHEFEMYRDDQYAEFPRYQWLQAASASAQIEQYRTFRDDPKWMRHSTFFTVDSQLNENALVTGGYVYGFLKNESARQVIRPSGANVAHSIRTLTQNRQKNHAGTLGFKLTNIADTKGLDVIGGMRLESVKTNSFTHLQDSAGIRRDERSNASQTALVERFEVRYRGLKNTSVSFKTRFEQKQRNQYELADVSKHEIFLPGNFNSGNPISEYDAGISHKNEDYRLTLVNRFWPVKLTVGLRYQAKDRDYDVRLDSLPAFYPGRIGHVGITRTEASIGASQLIQKRGSFAVKYSFRDEDIKTAAAGNGSTQDWEIHRLTGSWGGALTKKWNALSTVVFEKYDLKTPVDIKVAGTVANPYSDWAPGTEAYDYRADYVTALINTDYAFTPELKGTADYQVTDAMGNNKYIYQKVGGDLKYKLSKNATVGVGSEYFNFQDQAGYGFDDYEGYMFRTMYSYGF